MALPKDVQGKTYIRIAAGRHDTGGVACASTRYLKPIDILCPGTVGIGTASPNASAALDLSANTNSMLLPVGTTGQAPTCNTALQGATRYNTTNARPEYCNGSAWSPFRVGCSGSATGPDTSLASGLIAYWSFDENSGTVVNDLTGNNIIGSWQGTIGSQWTTGEINTAGNFNSSNNIVTVPASSLLQTTGSTTISAWVKANSTTSPYSTDYVVERGNDSSGAGWGIGLIQSNNQWEGSAVTTSPSTAGYNVTGGTVVAGSWTHLVVVFNNTAKTVTLYVNGTAVGSSATGSNLRVSTGSSFIGGGSNGVTGTSYYSGAIDEVGIWNVALSAAQVSTLYNSGAGDAFGATVCPAVITSSGGFTN